MRELRAEIEMAAPPERVWQVLSDLRCLSRVEPVHPFERGRRRSRVAATRRIEPPGVRGLTYKPQWARAVAPPRELRWLGRLLMPGLFDGEHRLAIEPLDGGRSKFVQSERFSAPKRPSALAARTTELRSRAGRVDDAMSHLSRAQKCSR